MTRELVEAIRRGDTEMKAPPQSLSVILEGRGCNLKCVYCSHIAIDGDDESWRVEYSPGKKLRSQVGTTFGTSRAIINSFKKLAPQIESLRFGGGEPLMYPEMWECTEIARDHNIEMALCTNGLLINDKLIDEILLQPNFRWLTISVDAATPETYSKIRVGGDLEKLCANLQHLKQKKGDREWPKVQFNYTVMRQNVNEIPMMINLAVATGASVVQFHALYDIQMKSQQAAQGVNVDDTPLGKMIDFLYESNILRTEKEAAATLGLIREAEQLGPISGVEVRAAPIKASIYNEYPQLKTEGVIKHTKATEIDFRSVFCYRPFTNMSVGHYRHHFCCYAKGDELDQFYDDDSLTIMDLWNSEMMRYARWCMLNGKAEEICRLHCPILLLGGAQYTTLRKKPLGIVDKTLARVGYVRMPHKMREIESMLLANINPITFQGTYVESVKQLTKELNRVFKRRAQ